MSRIIERRVKTLEDLVAGLTAPELGFIDGVTAGVAAPSKALVLDADGEIATIASLTATAVIAETVNSPGLTAGASGVAGLVTIFPTTADKGSATISVTDQTEDTVVEIVIGAMGQATVVTVPDPGGATADFILSAGNQTIAGTKTFTGGIVGTGVGMRTVVRQSADVIKDDGAAAGALTGLVHTLVDGATYSYKATIQCLSTSNGGAKITFGLTTAVLASLQNVARAFTASAVACARSTTATTGATLYGATAAITQIVLEGTMVVTTGGTIQLLGEQNASHADETTFYAGSTFEIHRIA